MKFKILKYEKDFNYHVCQQIHIRKSGGSNKENIDITIFGPFVRKENQDINNYHRFLKSLEGKTVEIETLEPYISIAYDVKIIKES